MSTTEYTTADDCTESGWAGQSLLRRGWSVGKKVAVAGAALSVAPVVIPPLLVFSAFGLALSVPFGVYYVGVVGTERLMQSLLPLDRGQDQVAERDQEEENFGYLDEREFEHEENWDGEGEDYEVELQGEGYVGMSDSKSEKFRGEQENGDTVAEEDIGETDAVNKEYGVAGYLNGTDEIVEKDLMPEKDGTTEDDVVEENGGMKRDDIEGKTENDNVIVESIVNVTGATVDSDSVTVMQIEITPDNEADVTTAVTEGGLELAGAEVIRAETGNTEVVDDKGVVTADSDSRVAKKEENDSSAVSSEGADASEAEDFNAAASASSESSVTSDVEEFYTKKELWVQLRALRTIVGYRAAIAKTLPGELRALYTFTGVEFPSTATDASNLLDLNYKLQFLKSIIGIK